MKAVIIGSTIKGIESALNLARKGYDTTILCSGTYIGEDITRTWKLYSEEHQGKLIEVLSGIADKYDLTAPEQDILYPGMVKRLLTKWIKQSSVKIHYMTRFFGAVVSGNILKGIVAADKHGLLYLPCQIGVDCSLYYETSWMLTGKPLQFPKGHPLTLRMELRNVSCSEFPHRLHNCDAALHKGIRDDRQAYLEAERTLPTAMSLFEIRCWSMQEYVRILSCLRDEPETVDSVPGETLPQVIDLTELPDKPEPVLNGWYLEMSEMDAASDNLHNAPATESISMYSKYSACEQIIVNGTRLPFSLDFNQKVNIDWDRLPQKRTDVLVAGMGTSGTWAAISAARAGGKVTAVELYPFPGGTRAIGGVNSLYYGNRNRLFQSMWKEIKDFTNITLGRKVPGMLHVLEVLFYAYEITKLGIDFYPNTVACGAQTDGEGNLVGVLCCGEDGVIVINAQRFIDSSGDGDIAALAGCSFEYGDDEMHAMQNYSQWNRCTPKRNGYRSIDQDTMDQTKRAEWIRALEWNMLSLMEYDMFDMLTVRETRRIIGRTVMTMKDAVRGKRTPDLIYEAYCTFDPHGRCMNITGRLGLMPAQGNPMFIPIPLGTLLPREVNNLMVVGKAISMDQDTFNYIRMNADVMCVGWIAGYLCTKSIIEGVPVDVLPLSDLQKQLYRLGAITLPVPIQDTYAISPDRIVSEILAGEEVGFRNAVLTDWEDIAEGLRSAYDMECYKTAELVEKTLLWFGDTIGAHHLTELLAVTNRKMGKVPYLDRQKADGFPKGGIVGELDDFWLINQLVTLLSRAVYKPAIPVILDVLKCTELGSGWENDTSHYAMVRLDCQSIANYDRILCLAEAAVLMPDPSYADELTRLYEDLEVPKAPSAPFYKEYLQMKLLAGMKKCSADKAKTYLEQMCRSRYSTISEYAQRLMGE